MTRHDSYQFGSSSTQPRAPPPLRSVQSYADSPTSSNKRSADKDDPDELTTKGRKRKRLAKACSACHKNKRRCDGFAPCSNCEFSSRPCLYLNANGEPIPPPRTRDSSDTPAVVARIGKDGKEEIAEPRSSARNGDRRLPDALDAVDHDPNISLELIDHFFHQVHPLSGMFHTPTFYDRLYRNVVSPVLLDCMYAMSARYATSPAFLACFGPKTPPHLRAIPFIDRARSGLDRLLTAYRYQTPEEQVRNAGTWEETETVQACVIFSLYLVLAIQTTLGLYYADTAREMLALTPAGLVPVPTAPMGLSKLEHLTLLEARNRTYWAMSWLQKCWIAVGRPKEVHSDGAVPLPGAESWWSRFGGSSAVEDVMRRRDSLTQKIGDWPGEEGQVGELGYVMRIMDLATRITALAGSATHGSPSSMSAVTVYQDQLKNWAQDLPPRMRFDERNLAEASRGLQSPMHHTAIASWLYAYMHALAECSMFFLQAIVALQPGSPYTAERQGQAVENLGVILEAMGPRGRSCPMVIFPLSVITNWQDHVKSCGTLTPSQRQFDDRLDRWWADHELNWGINRRTSDRLHEFGQEEKIAPFTMRPNWEGRTPTSAFSRDARDPRDPRDVRDPRNPRDVRERERDPRDIREPYQPPSTKQAWSAVVPSPPTMTDTGTTSNWTLPPPTPGSASYGLSASHSASSANWTRYNLPGARPRAHSNATPYSAADSHRNGGRSPSPPSGLLGKRHLPSMSALNDKQQYHGHDRERDRERERDLGPRQDGFRLPPLNELRMSHALKSPGEIGRNEHVFRMTPSPRARDDALGLSTGGSYRAERARERGVDGLLELPADRYKGSEQDERDREDARSYSPEAQMRYVRRENAGVYEREREGDKDKDRRREWSMSMSSHSNSNVREERYDKFDSSPRVDMGAKSRQQASLGLDALSSATAIAAPAVTESAAASAPSGIDALISAAETQQKEQKDEEERRSRSASAGMRKMSISASPVVGLSARKEPRREEEQEGHVVEEMDAFGKMQVGGQTPMKVDVQVQQFGTGTRMDREVSPRSMA